MTEVLTAREAAAEIFNGKTSYWQLLEMAKRSKIPHFRLSPRGRLFFRRSALIQWIAEREKASVEIENPTAQYGKLRVIRE